MPDIEMLGRKLESSDAEERREAAVDLGHAARHDSGAVPLLFRAMGDADWRVRKTAVEGLVSIGGARVINGLLQALNAPDNAGVRNSAIEALVQIGGPSGAYFPPSLLHLPMDYEALAQHRGMLGHGGMVLFDDRVDLAHQARFAMEFCAIELCGKCTPCRIGSARGVELVGASGPKGDVFPDIGARQGVQAEITADFDARTLTWECRNLETKKQYGPRTVRYTGKFDKLDSISFWVCGQGTQLDDIWIRNY